jgi:hypothetical protein
LSEKIDFFPHFNEATNCIVDISEKFKALITPEIIDSAKHVLMKTQHLRTPHNKVAMFSEIEVDEKGHYKSFLIQYFPYEIIDQILDEKSYC